MVWFKNFYTNKQEEEESSRKLDILFLFEC